MPIIIDANRASDFKPPAKYHAPVIYQAVSNGRARIVVGGKLLRELAAGGLGAMLVEWGRAGRLVKIADDKIQAATPNTVGCKSNDSHVVALAIAANTSLLYTNDDDLIEDFKNKKYVKPRGKIIKSETKDKIVKALIRIHGP